MNVAITISHKYLGISLKIIPAFFANTLFKIMTTMIIVKNDVGMSVKEKSSSIKLLTFKLIVPFLKNVQLKQKRIELSKSDYRPIDSPTRITR